MIKTKIYFIDMKKSLILIFSFCFTLICFSQTNCFYINKIDRLAYSTVDSTIFTGICKHFYNNGKPKGECVFKNGILISERGWFKNGQISDSSFNIECNSGAFEDCGSFYEYKWWENGNPKYKTVVTNWKSNGPYVMYYENGNKKEEGNSKMTKLDGLIKYYYKNGTIKHEYFYRNDSLIYSNHFDKNGKKN
jgi:antitoxin component YwqK of YwqJK toxin-antitoxin module